MTHGQPLQVAFSAFTRVQEQPSLASFAPPPLAALSPRVGQHKELLAEAVSAERQCDQQHEALEEQSLVHDDSSRPGTHQPTVLFHSTKPSLNTGQPEEERLSTGQMTTETPKQHREGSDVPNKSSVPDVKEDVFDFLPDEQPPSSSLVVQEPPVAKPRKTVRTAARVVRTVREATATLPGTSDHAVEQKGAASKRKRSSSHRNAADSGSEVSLECSEVFSESEGESESECDRRPKRKAKAANRAGPSIKKGPTVTQLKQRCFLANQYLGTQSLRRTPNWLRHLLFVR